MHKWLLLPVVCCKTSSTHMPTLSQSCWVQWQRPEQHTLGSCSPKWKDRPRYDQTVSQCSPLQEEVAQIMAEALLRAVTSYQPPLVELVRPLFVAHQFLTPTFFGTRFVGPLLCTFQSQSMCVTLLNILPQLENEDRWFVLSQRRRKWKDCGEDCEGW